MPATVAHETRSLADAIQDRIDAAVAAGDQKALDDLLNELYEPSETAHRPYDAAIQLRPDAQTRVGGNCAGKQRGAQLGK